MGGTQQLARLAGGLAGLGLAFAAAAPFSGVPPQGVSGEPAPAQVEVRALAGGELDVDPVGVVLERTAFPKPGERGGPSLKLTVTNVSAVPLRVSMRLAATAPALGDAATVRASAAGAVLFDGPLKDAGEWTLPSGLLSSGERTTLRIRFKLKPGLSDDAYRGRIDVRELEMMGVALTAPSEETESTTPTATSPAPTTPVGTSPSPTPPTAEATTP